MIGACFINEADGLGIPHPPLIFAQVSTVSRNVVTFIADCLALIVRIFITFFSQYLPVFACGGLSHHYLLSFLNQNPCLGTIFGDTAEMECIAHVVITLPHCLQHWKGSHEKGRFWLEECRKWVRGYATVHNNERPHYCTDRRHLRTVWLGPRGVTEWVYISLCHNIISIYPSASQRYTPGHLVHHRYASNSVHCLLPSPSYSQ